MKKYSYLLLSFLFLSFTSCLKGDLDDLPEFDINDISGVQRVEYRYISNETSNASGQNIVKFVTLTNKNTVDKNTKKVSIQVAVPIAGAAFPETERAKCTAANIAVMVSLSTAARVAPVGDAPKFGIPGDWSKANKYIVTAANGDTAEWTVEVTEFNK